MVVNLSNDRHLFVWKVVYGERSHFSISVGKGEQSDCACIQKLFDVKCQMMYLTTGSGEFGIC